ncbi:FAD-dependent monooxygenase [Synechococcus sp. Tobar12-5m-g]|uniref:FAD-dependent monooxygenase n=1 Tax=unclassified Synechococcus TaxID=2626047 RepID=UPI0020CC82AA|nr:MULTISPECIES: FAD-dependent monooxygenase [unclassified Synechococcus]MCP9772678.1 FAD-dependent monooxygenase [Synechococcus sp. Tobar12-5m-g]MCP9873466.1 FAD-dependent monooxygenase [Synechococcus sp. Cruz CV-v-12]
MQQPVVIVGAGPAGTCLALLLAERDLPVILVEAARDLGRRFRGEALMPSGLDALDQIGLTPLLQTLPGRTLSGWAFRVNGRELFRVDEPMGSDRPCTLVSQPALLKAMIARAGRCGGFRWLPGQRALALVIEDDRVAGVRLADGRILAAALVIAADGRSSLLRGKAGLALEQSSSPIDLLWFRLPAHPLFEADNLFLVQLGAGGGFSVFHGATPGELQLGWLLAPGARIERSASAWAEAFAQLSPDWLAEHFQAQAGAITPPQRLSVQVGIAPRWHRPGLLLLGDAAHPMSPVRAQGLNMALRDALVAANHLVPVLCVQAGPAAIDRALAAIQAEREPEIHQAQALQGDEARQGELLARNPLVRDGVARLSPWIGPALKRAWMARQGPLREGFSPVRLRV